MIIGLSGYARTGKDSVAQIMVRQGIFERHAFADELKRALYALNPAIGFNSHTGRVTYLKSFIDAQNGSFEKKWEKAKAIDEVRRLLQRLGTEVGREILGENIWVDVVFRNISDSDALNFVITDVRFPNEAQRVKDEGGYMIRILRSEVGPARNDNGHVHRSEIALDDWEFDYYLHNNGDLSDLYENVKNLYFHIKDENHWENTVGEPDGN